MSDRLDHVSADLSELGEIANDCHSKIRSLGDLVNSREEKFEEVLHAARNGNNGYVTDDLVRASNKHTTNFTATMAAIDDINTRLRDVENNAPAAAHIARITQLEATMNSTQNTIKTLISRVSALSGTSPPTKFGDAESCMQDAANFRDTE
ncbi:hypothetical protein C8R44DRAFT_734761 [Mycena epipterygia]|nr:hypothetical protein C8R44DRAFT_734761 [Mycena epipterygia]